MIAVSGVIRWIAVGGFEVALAGHGYSDVEQAQAGLLALAEAFGHDGEPYELETGTADVAVTLD